MAKTFFFVLVVWCYVAQGQDEYIVSESDLKNTMTSSVRNIFTKMVSSPSADKFTYNETIMRAILDEMHTNSSSWDEFDVYLAPQQGLQAADKISRLPGQPNVKFDQYSGYVTVNEEGGRALFYYFVESTKNPSTKPLVLWLNGGPGCSSLIGAMMELGPFRVMKGSETLAVNPYAWNKVANMIFLESPAGVGFSYVNDSSNYSPGDKITAQDSYTFLINWLERFPQYKNQDFFIAGESYAGHYAPQLAKLILQKNKKATPTGVINLRGIVIGNGMVDDYCKTKGNYEFFVKHGIISRDIVDTITQCDIGTQLDETKCENARSTLDSNVERINIYGLNEPVCNLSSNIPQNAKYDPCTEEYSKIYLNKPEVQEALHSKSTKWDMCRYNFTWNDDEFTVLLTIKELMASGLRVWLYSGDTDGAVSVESTEYALKALELSVKTARYPWYNAPNELGGYATEYYNLTFVTVKDTGHLVPFHEPSRALKIFSNFLKGKFTPTGLPNVLKAWLLKKEKEAGKV